MKKIILSLVVLFGVMLAIPCFAAPPGGGHGPGGRPGFAAGAGMRPMGRPPMHASASFRHDIGHRPPMGAPVGGHRLPMHHIAARPLPPPPPPIYRPYRPVPLYRPFYSGFYTPSIYYSYTYPYSSYIYDGVETVLPATGTVIVRDNYAGINTAANVINAAANVASTIRYLTW